MYTYLFLSALLIFTLGYVADAVIFTKNRNIYHVQFTILFNHSYNYMNRNPFIFHHIKARETPYFGKQRQYASFSMQISWIQTDRQTHSMTDGQNERLTNRNTDNDKLRQTEWHSQTKANLMQEQNSLFQTDRQTDK